MQNTTKGPLFPDGCSAKLTRTTVGGLALGSVPAIDRWTEWSPPSCTDVASRHQGQPSLSPPHPNSPSHRPRHAHDLRSRYPSCHRTLIHPRPHPRNSTGRTPRTTASGHTLHTLATTTACKEEATPHPPPPPSHTHAHHAYHRSRHGPNTTTAPRLPTSPTFALRFEQSRVGILIAGASPLDSFVGHTPNDAVEPSIDAERPVRAWRAISPRDPRA